MDLIDQAQETEQRYRDQQLARVQDQIAAGELLATASNCIDCDAMIPSQRQAALPGVQTCVGCAEIRERAAKLRRAA